MKKKIGLFLNLFISTVFLSAQSTAYILSGGGSIASQTWNGQDRQPLFTYHTDAMIEFLSDWRSDKKNPTRSSVLLSLGYHPRGNAIRSFYIDPINANERVRFTSKAVFHNISLSGMAKNAHRLSDKAAGYYAVGVRAEYTAKDSLNAFSYYRPYIKKFVFGLNISGGIEWEFSPSLGMGLEFRVSPDVTNQIYIPAGYYPVYNNSGQLVSTDPIAEQKVRNLSFEIALSFRFLQRMEYEEDMEE